MKSILKIENVVVIILVVIKKKSQQVQKEAKEGDIKKYEQ